MLRSVNNFAKSFEFGKDGLGGRGPHERLGMLVVMVDKGIDLSFEIGHGLERATTNG